MAEILSAAQQTMVALFQQHVDAELCGDLETTMATMSADPHLNHVPQWPAAWAERATR
jgi:carboxymethylenebutenolidase